MPIQANARSLVQSVTVSRMSKLKRYSLQCADTFRNSWKRNAHTRKCTGTPPRALKIDRTCRLCDGKFPNEPQLLQHFETTHVGEQPFVCSNCDQSFATDANRRMHDRVCELVCRVCATTFTTRDKLVDHYKQEHDSERAFTCGKCNRECAHVHTCIEFCTDAYRKSWIRNAHARRCRGTAPMPRESTTQHFNRKRT
jgi:hypothetical protein